MSIKSIKFYGGSSKGGKAKAKEPAKKAVKQSRKRK